MAVNEMYNEKFNNALLTVQTNHIRAGIGTLGERTLHAVLKNYFEPFPENHEIKIGGFIADIVGEHGIIEIQTRQFYSLRKKLNAFLEAAVVTVVYPITSTKWLIWADTETGEITKKRKSPKKGTKYDVFFELYQIKQLVTHPNFRLCIVLTDMEEYRKLNGYSADKKKGSSRYERIPIGIVDEIFINDVLDYKKLIPEGLPKNFTVKDYKKESRITTRCAQYACNVLCTVGVIKHIGKNGNAYIYTIS